MALTTEAALRKDHASALSTMEHRHFATVAAIIKDMDGEDFEGLRPVIARTFADGLRHTNPKFDRARFLRACGVPS